MAPIMPARPRRSLADRIHPLVVRDVRRALREKAVPTVLSLVPAGCLVLCWLTVEEAELAKSGALIASILWSVSVLVAWFLSPISCYR